MYSIKSAELWLLHTVVIWNLVPAIGRWTNFFMITYDFSDIATVPPFRIFFSLTQYVVHSATSCQMAADESLRAPYLDEISCLLFITVCDDSLRTLWILDLCIVCDEMKLCGRSN